MDIIAYNYIRKIKSHFGKSRRVQYNYNLDVGENNINSRDLTYLPTRAIH